MQTKEILSTEHLDRILAKLCEMVIAGQERDADTYGCVAACVLDPNGVEVCRINLPDSKGKRIHAERMAVNAYVSENGPVPPGSTVITTLSPCSEAMDDRHGESCSRFLHSIGIKRVYCGYIDPTQDTSSARFRVVETKNEKLKNLCRKIASTFLDEDAEPAMMAKIESTGKIVRIIRKQHEVKFSDEKDWLLIDTDPAKGNRGLGLKWIPASTRFSWVRPYRGIVDEKINYDITHQKWHAEKKIELSDGSQAILRARNTSDIVPPQFVVDVFTADNRHIGNFRFLVMDWEQPKTGWFAKNPTRDPYVMGGNIRVNDEFQRKGIARAVYSWVKSMGNDIKPSDTRTAAGKSMWSSFEKTPLDQAVAEDLEDYQGLKIKLSKDSDGVAVRALSSDGNRELGMAELFFDEQGRLDPQTLWVDERYYGQGIAKAMYDYLKVRGYTVIRSWDQTPAGKGFWDKHRGPDVTVWENFADGKGPGRPGDSQRHGIPKHATMAQLEKASHAKGRKGQLARWQINMRRGHKK